MASKMAVGTRQRQWLRAFKRLNVYK